MTAIQCEPAQTCERGERLTPQKLANAVSKYAQHYCIPPKTAERHITLGVETLTKLAAICRTDKERQWLNGKLAKFDAARMIDGEPLTCDTAFACSIQRDVLAEAGSLTEYIADKSPEHLADLERKTRKVVGECLELLASVEQLRRS